MSDLISRRKIRDYIQTQINPYGKPFEGTAYELGLKIMKYIDAMDSAYDVEKVDNGWIPCSEKLPEKNGEYLVQNIHGVICVAHYNYNSPCTYRAFFVGYTQVKNPVAWMPLPKPYRPEGRI